MTHTRQRSVFALMNPFLKSTENSPVPEEAIIHQRRCLVNSKNGELKLRVILDRFSAEVFINDGEQVMTATIYTDQSAEEISFFADGDVNIDVVKYDLV